MEHFDISLGDSLSSLSFQILSSLLFFLLSFIKLLSSPFTCHTSSKLQFQKLSFSLARIVWLSHTHTPLLHTWWSNGALSHHQHFGTASFRWSWDYSFLDSYATSLLFSLKYLLFLLLITNLTLSCSKDWQFSGFLTQFIIPPEQGISFEILSSSFLLLVLRM